MRVEHVMMVKGGHGERVVHVPDAGVGACELLDHVVGIAAVVFEEDAVELGWVGVGAEVRGC